MILRRGYTVIPQSPHPTFFVGTGLIITGALIRAWCFSALGSLFTFETGIVEENHRLVVSGPYAYVRSVY